MFRVHLSPHGMKRARQLTQMRREGFDLPCSIVEHGASYHFTKQDRRNALVLAGRMIVLNQIREYVIRSKRGRPSRKEGALEDARA